MDRGVIREALTDFSHAWNERIGRWRQDGQRGTEKSFAQQYWSDLLRCFGVIPERIDLFERGAQRATTGRHGFIDFFWSGVAVGEAKSLGEDLDAAHDQALDYLAGGSIGQHEWPKYVLVTDFERLRVERLGEAGWAREFTVAEVVDHVDELMFLAGRDTVTKAEEQDASIQAAKLMAQMFTALVGEEADVPVGDAAPEEAEEEDYATQQASILLTRLLFLLYGDDAGLWEADLFHRWVESDTSADSLGPQLDGLFRVLNTPAQRRRGVPVELSKFPYVNGGIFDSTGSAGFLTTEFREALLAACRFRWTAISPAVFGSMFQLVKSREARRGDGEHYTSETNILKTIGPLFLDEYRVRADRLIANRSTTRREALALIEEMASNVYIDPACGAGNFLNLAYAKLREIETDLLADMKRRSGNTMDQSLDATFDQRVHIDQFYGIEINWWPAKIAETAMFLVDHQANRRLAAALGQAPVRLPITMTATIYQQDALSLDWAGAFPTPVGRTYVFGNPPFLGDTTRTKVQLAQMAAAWGGSKELSRLDYVTAWHALTLRLLENRDGEWAFVTTNSIVQGDQPARLFAPIFDAGWRIKFAHRTFQWDSEAPGRAAVHCVIIGFTRESTFRPRLFDYASTRAQPVERAGVKQINAYLVDGPNVLVTKRSRPLSADLNMPMYGSKPSDGGHLLIGADELEHVRADPIAALFLRPYVGARELLHDEERWCLWLVDATGEQIAASPVLRARVEAVRQFRASSAAASTRDYRHHHLFRQVQAIPGDFVCIPRHVSEERPYFPVKLLPEGVIASDATFQCADPDGFQFAMLSSSMYLTWQKTVGGRLKSDLRFGSTITWTNLPLPPLNEVQRTRIIAAGQKVLDARALHPQRSLAQHYNRWGMDPALVQAHDALDTEVDKAFGAPRRCRTELERQELLFARYSDATAQTVL